ncbi:uncharacterized protein [Chironomus tepperi]
MITKEVNDTQLNLKKILYEPEKDLPKDKDQESSVQSVSQKNFTDIQIIDDDDRLVIDISDDEIEGLKKKKNKAKSMPILDFGIEGTKNTNRMPKSITYSVETTGISSSCVKIDILTSTGSYYNLDAVDMSKVVTSIPKHANISLNDELNILSHEIDKQINKKTLEILELVKEYLGNQLNEDEFHSRMNDIGNVSVSDLSTIAKKLIKRQKFEANPNQKDFMRMKFLQFPTSSKDLVNYFKNLIPSMNKERFVNMIKFYEIIIKEMFNLNKTKILQYLIDFMVKRKNAQLDMLNYNYETNSSPNLMQKVSSTFEMPDSTQSINPQRKIAKLQTDTSYNFVIRSDPIYLTAGSTFMTNHRDVIKSRIFSRVQNHNFERRPFDNHILKGRRMARRLMNAINEEDKNIHNMIEANKQFDTVSAEIKSQMNNIPILPALLSKGSSLEEHLLKPKIENESFPTLNSSKADSVSPILVDTPSSSPPIHKIIKPQILSQQILQRAFSDRFPAVSMKEQMTTLEKFPILNHKPSISYQNNVLPNRQSLEQQSIESNTSSNTREPMINGQLSLNEIITLNQNGTEIIPTPILRNTITSRRKTIDVDHAPAIKTNVDVKKIQPFPNEVIKSSSLPVTKSSLSFLYEQSQLNKQASKILKRRQSCHERIFTPKPTNANNIERHFMNFMNGEYESKKREAEMKRMPNLALNDGKSLQFQHKQLDTQKPTPPLYAQQKRVRFMSDETSELPQRSPQTERTQLTPNSQKPHQSENSSPRALFRETLQNSLMQPPLKPYQSTIDYQRYQLYFERELRERGFVDRVEKLQDGDSNPVSLNRPLELVSHVPPERYLQHPEPTQLNTFTSPKLTRPLDKSPRIQHRTPIMTNDEKATLVAYNQLQSLHRDPSNLTAQQYSEHLKQLHQFKQMQKISLNSSQGFYQDRSSQLLDGRDNSYKNLQQSFNHQSENVTSARFYPSQGNDMSNDKEQQSLQRKLKLKAKSTKYVEPSQLSKAYQSTPRSTYYTDPYTTHKKPPTPTSYNLSQDRPIEQHSQEQLSAFYNMRTESSINSQQLQYQWMLAQHHQQQQQHQQQHQNLMNQPARPIPRPAIPSPFNDAKLNGIPPNHNIFSHNPMQTFSNQQSDFYRRYFPKSF